MEDLQTETFGPVCTLEEYVGAVLLARWRCHPTRDNATAVAANAQQQPDDAHQHDDGPHLHLQGQCLAEVGCVESSSTATLPLPSPSEQAGAACRAALATWIAHARLRESLDRQHTGPALFTDRHPTATLPPPASLAPPASRPPTASFARGLAGAVPSGFPPTEGRSLHQPAEGFPSRFEAVHLAALDLLRHTILVEDPTGDDDDDEANAADLQIDKGGRCECGYCGQCLARLTEMLALKTNEEHRRRRHRKPRPGEKEKEAERE
eukprot:GHVT01072454.1.p1 GENE.GHVT01072454.1~~GHVT01072454.1.p1  ORF type:complete len:301 (+),score=79.10 GHVT01072454.1:110-904(+)